MGKQRLFECKIWVHNMIDSSTMVVLVVAFVLVLGVVTAWSAATAADFRQNKDRDSEVKRVVTMEAFTCKNACTGKNSHLNCFFKNVASCDDGPGDDAEDYDNIPVESTYKSAPGLLGGKYMEFDRDGKLYTEGTDVGKIGEGMSARLCKQIAEENGWSTFGHRNSGGRADTCFRIVVADSQAAEFVDSGGDPGQDRGKPTHTTFHSTSIAAKKPYYGPGNYASAIGLVEGEYINYDSQGNLGKVDNDMTEQKCTDVAEENGWATVGHRNLDEGEGACFLIKTPNSTAQEFIDKGGDPEQDGYEACVGPGGVGVPLLGGEKVPPGPFTTGVEFQYINSGPLYQKCDAEHGVKKDVEGRGTMIVPEEIPDKPFFAGYDVGAPPRYMADKAGVAACKKRGDVYYSNGKDGCGVQFDRSNGRSGWSAPPSTMVVDGKCIIIPPTVKTYETCPGVLEWTGPSIAAKVAVPAGPFFADGPQVEYNNYQNEGQTACRDRGKVFSSDCSAQKSKLRGGWTDDATTKIVKGPGGEYRCQIIPPVIEKERTEERLRDCRAHAEQYYSECGYSTVPTFSLGEPGTPGRGQCMIVPPLKSPANTTFHSASIASAKPERSTPEDKDDASSELASLHEVDCNTCGGSFPNGNHWCDNGYAATILGEYPVNTAKDKYGAVIGAPLTCDMLQEPGWDYEYQYKDDGKTYLLRRPSGFQDGDSCAQEPEHIPTQTDESKDELNPDDLMPRDDEAEEQAKREAEEQAKREAEEQAKREAEEKAKREAEEQAKKADNMLEYNSARGLPRRPKYGVTGYQDYNENGELGIRQGKMSADDCKRIARNNAWATVAYRKFGSIYPRTCFRIDMPNTEAQSFVDEAAEPGWEDSSIITFHSENKDERARREADENARNAAEEQARKVAEEQAKKAAEAQEAEEARAREEAERQAKVKEAAWAEEERKAQQGKEASLYQSCDSPNETSYSKYDTDGIPAAPFFTKIFDMLWQGKGTRAQCKKAGEHYYEEVCSKSWTARPITKLIHGRCQIVPPRDGYMPEYKSAPGLMLNPEYSVGAYHDYNKEGELDKQGIDMTANMCKEIAEKNGWATVGYRKWGGAPNTCFRVDVPNSQSQSFVDKGGEPYQDGGNPLHVTFHSAAVANAGGTPSPVPPPAPTPAVPPAPPPAPTPAPLPRRCLQRHHSKRDPDHPEALLCVRWS